MIEFKITENSCQPKYVQIANQVIDHITYGTLQLNQKMPSVNLFSKEYAVSRDTVEKAYNLLKTKKVLIAKKGKGTYVNLPKNKKKEKIIFFINKLCAYKLKIYEAFVDQLGDKYQVDIEIYHCDEQQFIDLLAKNINRYDYYVVMPHFMLRSEKFDEYKHAINTISKEKLIILDNNDLVIDGDIIEIYQDFERDVYIALRQGFLLLKKYNKFNLIVPSKEQYPYIDKIIRGVQLFCNKHKIEFSILSGVSNDEQFKIGELFITIEDGDLVNLLDCIKTKEVNNIGVLSYNDTPFKKLLGVSVISTNYTRIGNRAASMILNQQKGRIKNPIDFIVRDSV
ncbi:winged helix-turn-helix domain-containing protein [Wenyingzhuangia sp. chi5]|uniref:Winged helix-turn-helix domain-containing protein n=1 Tax=Wenyingzhuangia gilva TaxID=3057677 RepID=A0ABT8VQT4_9FLAO|nr:winged helix-turn-helix domain-containing protein [Wenyingzhuangia sp. chi5]MDO3694307.1 winged helix-turn-helix domain-containing protein [Wenyingzhuangia sp. chi5]